MEPLLVCIVDLAAASVLQESQPAFAPVFLSVLDMALHTGAGDRTLRLCTFHED